MDKARYCPCFQIHRRDRPDTVIEIADEKRARTMYRQLKETAPSRGYSLRVVYWRLANGQ